MVLRLEDVSFQLVHLRGQDFQANVSAMLVRGDTA
jgi:hypothetical protein